MADAELNLTLKNATFVKDPDDNSKYIFGPIGSIEQIGGSFKNDEDENVEFGDNIAKLTKDSLTTRINEKMAPKEEEKPAVENKPADKTPKEKAIEAANAELVAANAELVTAGENEEEKKTAQAKVKTAQAKVNEANEMTGGRRKSRKAKRTKKGGKKRRNTQRHHRKSR